MFNKRHGFRIYTWLKVIFTVIGKKFLKIFFCFAGNRSDDVTVIFQNVQGSVTEQNSCLSVEIKIFRLDDSVVNQTFEELIITVSVKNCSVDIENSQCHYISFLFL